MNPSRPEPDSTKPCRIWVLASYRAGENSQLIALAEALELPFEVKSLAYRRNASPIGLLRLRSRAGIKRRISATLERPWPDLVLTAGLRNEPVARWIRRRSGGHSQLVFLGRSWASANSFDLVVTTPQYRLPRHANIRHNDTTMQRITPARLNEAARHWRPRLGELPAPVTAVILGGNSGPYRFGPQAAGALARRLNRLVADNGGSLLISSSSRTPEAAIEAMRNTLDVPHQLYAWRPDDTDNPYFGYLALADQIVVTSDSIAMLSEACATQKPVFIFDLGGRHPEHDPPDFEPDRDLPARAYALMMRGPKRLTRDLELVHQHLIEAGRARWLGDPFPPQRPPPLTEVEDTAAELRRLIAAK